MSILILKMLLERKPPDIDIQGELRAGVGPGDQLGGVPTVVASQQHDALRRVPAGVSQSGML